MPAYSRTAMAPWARVVVVAFALGLLVFVLMAPASYLAFTAIALATIWFITRQVAKKDNDHRRKIAASREESICTFARSFDVRGVDTWVIRAVYEELREWLAQDGRPFPVRAQDALVRDLRIDPEDIDMSLAPAIAQRTGRSLERSERNPYSGKVQSVADLVMFFEHQPSETNGSSRPNTPRGSA
jgi:hypothetical protein